MTSVHSGTKVADSNHVTAHFSGHYRHTMLRKKRPRGRKVVLCLMSVSDSSRKVRSG
jgi:hypothetical protein